MDKLAIFASGNGSNFQRLIEAINHNELQAEIAVLISDKPNCYAVTRAKIANIPTFTFVPQEYQAKEEYEKEILQVLEKYNVKLIVLAGYMRIVGPTLLKAYDRKIINIHPSLLPAFPGKEAIRQAYEFGVKITGVTIHYIDADIDSGPIIAQEPVKIEAFDTLETLTAKIHQVEHDLLPRVIEELLIKVRR